MRRNKVTIIALACLICAALAVSDTYYHWVNRLFSSSGAGYDSNNNGIPDDQESSPLSQDSLQLVRDGSAFDPTQVKGVPFTTYQVNPQVETDLVHEPSGSFIHIPANAFLRADGSVETGNVTVYYREFHNYFDAMISGVGMDYEENGNKYALETAGMIHIEANSGSGRLAANPGAPIKIELATQKPNLSANVYRMNGYLTGLWLQEGLSRVYEKSDVSLLPPPNKPVLFDEIGFSLEDEVGDSPNLLPYTNCYFMPRDGQAHGSSCNRIDVKHQGEGAFEVSFEYAVNGNRIWNDACICDLVVPSGYHHSLIDEYQAKFGAAVRKYDDLIQQDRRAKQNYELAMDEWKVENQRRRTQRYRDMEVLSFGLWNCDRPLPYPKPTGAVFASKFQDANGKAFHAQYVSVLERGSDFAFTYPIGGKISYNPKKEFALILQCPDGTMAFVSSRQCNRVREGRATGVLTVNLEEVKTVGEFKSLLFNS